MKASTTLTLLESVMRAFVILLDVIQDAMASLRCSIDPRVPQYLIM
jgi:hypothetical protein